MKIWDIKPRWLRVAVAWPLAIICLVALILAGVALIVASAGKGAYLEVKEFVEEQFSNREWLDLFKAAWAAMTGKDSA